MLINKANESKSYESSNRLLSQWNGDVKKWKCYNRIGSRDNNALIDKPIRDAIHENIETGFETNEDPINVNDNVKWLKWINNGCEYDAVDFGGRPVNAMRERQGRRDQTT